MSTSQKFLSGIILGVAAGVAIALFAQTDKGKEILADVKDAADEAGESLKSRFNQFEQEMKRLLKKGKAFVDDIESKAKDVADSVVD